MEPDSTLHEKGNLLCEWKLQYTIAAIMATRVGLVQESIKAVVSYNDDVYVWVYLDQIDRVLRYEAYVIDYDDTGSPSTLRMVIEEGVLDNLHEVELMNNLLHRYLSDSAYAQAPLLHAYAFTPDGQLVTTPPLLYFYNYLSEEELAQVHAYFTEQETALKRDKKARWMRTLRALGFDVVYNLG
jgi:hypothetical protein